MIPAGFSKRELVHSFEEISSVENLLLAWREFIRGKRDKSDVQAFQLHLMDNILSLHQELKNKIYTHGGYQHFKISDPKPRDIHKASVKDRLVHHAIYRVLYPCFARRFIYDSFSCQKGKGTHKALARFRSFAGKVSKNNTRTCWVLKCDIRKFFASIDHRTLRQAVGRGIPDAATMWLLNNIITSFGVSSSASATTTSYTERPSDIIGYSGRGLPLGNLTSQLLVNIYMHEFDQWVKHTLKQRYYIRYADDFVFFSQKRPALEALVVPVAQCLRDRLKLALHPNKVFIRTLASGVDFLGWVHFPDHRVLRTATKRRMLRRLSMSQQPETIASYRGLLRQGSAKKLILKYLH